MANAFEQFRDASFGGFRFPWKTYDIRGGIRDHVHEYPHVHGGDPEKLGRKLYEISFTPIIQAGLIPRRYQHLFPATLQNIRRLFEEQVTEELVIPHVGSIKAYAVTWNEKADSRNLSGVDPEWVFREDASASFGQQLIVDTRRMSSAMDNWSLEADVIKPRPSIFDAINDGALAVLSIKDQLDLYGNLVAAKIEGLVSLIQEADAQVQSFKDPDNYGALAALQRLLASTVDLANDIADRGQGLQIHTVALTMSITQVATAVHGNPSRASEIMQLNALDNPLAIPAGTKVVYYAD